jgi:hypothetical protein
MHALFDVLILSVLFNLSILASVHCMDLCNISFKLMYKEFHRYCSSVTLYVKVKFGFCFDYNYVLSVLFNAV